MRAHASSLQSSAPSGQKCHTLSYSTILPYSTGLQSYVCAYSLEHNHPAACYRCSFNGAMLFRSHGSPLRARTRTWSGFVQLSSNASRTSFVTEQEASLLKQSALVIEALPGKGKGIVYKGNGSIPAGTAIWHELPLVSVSDPHSQSDTCQNCYMSLVDSQPTICECGALYCSPACKDAAFELGHDALCGGCGSLDLYCHTNNVNFPRTAAAMLARSLSVREDFSTYWERVNRLVHASTGLSADASPEEYPVGWRTGYALVKDAISPRMGGNKEAFFGTVFNLRFYSRLMSTLRLNTFSFPCPLDRPVVRKGTGPPHSSDAPTASPPTSTSPAQDGCCSSDPAASAGESCGTESSCGSSLAKAGEAPGGTVLYALASFANHECDPLCEVQLQAGAHLTLRTRKEVLPGQEITVTYLDSSLDVAIRQAKLRLYGFECRCGLCTRQLAARPGRPGGTGQADQHFRGPTGKYRGEFDA